MLGCRTKWDLQSSPHYVLFWSSVGLEKAIFYKFAPRNSFLTKNSLEWPAWAKRFFFFNICFMKIIEALYGIKSEVSIVTNLIGIEVQKSQTRIIEECSCNKRFFGSVHLMALANRQLENKSESKSYHGRQFCLVI